MLIRDGATHEEAGEGRGFDTGREHDYLSAATTVVFADRKLTAISADLQ
ncbi:MAG TPA: hypothetical protein GXX48_02525 [Ochrobactrum intermedium]|uniref:Uncharacterized protein n=1 Tax=Brucella intermedia TaxID=94625 RepID=A0A7V6TY44_9HYPH|nr:hypothetical protein [Brucella intermedia]HHV66515.1 hypothetical protein [Brucella intermedia]